MLFKGKALKLQMTAVKTFIETATGEREGERERKKERERNKFVMTNSHQKPLKEVQ